MMFIWLLKVKCSSIVNPRYLISCFGISLTPFSFIFRLGIGTFFFLNTISSVLDEFRDILFAISQLFSDLRSRLRRLTMFAFLILLGGIYSRFVSSAKWKLVELCIHWCKSFMYIRNRRGPKTDPWGTPCSVRVRSDFSPSIDTNCCLSVRYDLNQLLLMSDMP